MLGAPPGGGHDSRCRVLLQRESWGITNIVLVLSPAFCGSCELRSRSPPGSHRSSIVQRCLSASRQRLWPVIRRKQFSAGCDPSHRFGSISGIWFVLVRLPQTFGDASFLALLQTIGGPCPQHSGTTESSFTIFHRLSHAHELLPKFAHHFVPFPSRLSAYAPADPPTRPGRRPATGRRGQRKEREIRQVAVLEVTGRLSDAIEDLDQAVQVALAEGPRGVVCDLSAVIEDADPGAVEMLATAGRHVRDWPGTPVAVACPDPQVREALRVHPVGGHLIVTESMFSAVSAVLATPTLVVEQLRLAAHPTVPSAAREFVTRTLRDWHLDAISPFASLVVSELVANSCMGAGTDIDLSVTWNLGALRVTVGDHGPALPGQRPSSLDLHGRGLTTVVAGRSRTFGVLPTADGGKVVWAVLEAPRQHLSTRTGMRKSKTEPEKQLRRVADRLAPSALHTRERYPQTADGSSQNVTVTTDQING